MYARFEDGRKINPPDPFFYNGQYINNVSDELLATIDGYYEVSDTENPTEAPAEGMEWVSKWELIDNKITRVWLQAKIPEPYIDPAIKALARLNEIMNGY